MRVGWSGVNTRSSGTGHRSCRRGEKSGFRVYADRRLQWPDLEGIGLFQIGKAQMISVILRLGDEVIRDRDGGSVGMLSLSGSGRGVKMVIRERLYVVPIRRVKWVLEGKEKKGVAFMVK